MCSLLMQDYLYPEKELSSFITHTYVALVIIESVDSISRDERDTP